MFKFFFLLAFTQILSQHLEIDDLHQNPILLLKEQNCYIQTGIIKIVHPINLTSLEENVSLFINISRKIDKTFPLASLIVRKSRQLADNLYKLKPMKRSRQKRWDIIGKGWKWLAGNPDADDLRIINSTFNSLIDQSNEQIKINEIINERISKITHTINEITSINNLLLNETSAISLLISLDTMNGILEEIEDAILRARVSLANSKLLTLKEIFMIETIMNDQGITTNFPEEALSYTKPKIASKTDMLLYILEVPKTNDHCEIIKIIPLVVNNTIITNTPSYIVKSNKKLYTTNHPESSIQQLHNTKPFLDECIFPIIMGLSSHCSASRTNQTDFFTLPGSNILMNNAKEQYISSNCGPHNRTLTGNFLLHFQNCTIQIANYTFTSEETFSNTVQLTGIFPGLSINKQIINEQDLSSLSWKTTNNRHRIDHIQLQQFEHRNWLFGLFGGMSTTAIIIITIAILCFRRKRVVFTVKYPKFNRSPKQTQKPEVSQSTEDVRSYPPEELRDSHHIDTARSAD